MSDQVLVLDVMFARDAAMNSPLVSVIIPAYNAASFITETIESVLGQTYKNIEVLVVDDGSQDNTPQIVQAFAERDARVTLLQQANQGVAAARNLAIDQAKGELIAPIDADDIWYSQKLEKQVHCILQSDPNVGLVYAWSATIDGNSNVIWSYRGYKSIHSVWGNAFLPLIYFNFLDNASSPLIRRACFEKVGGYDTQLHAQNAQGCEDLSLYLRIAEHFNFAVVPEFLIGYRLSENSMSTNLAAMEKSYYLVLAEAQQEIEVPKPLVRWSQSHFIFHLGLRACKYRDHSSALKWIYQAAKLDPVICLHPLAFRVSLRCAVILVLKSILSSFQDDSQIYQKGGQLLQRKWHVEYRTLPDIAVECAQPDVRNLYYWIFLRRWNQVLQLKPRAIASLADPASVSIAEAISQHQPQA